MSESFGGLPLRFEANRGQTDPQVKFVSRGDGYTLFLTSDGAVVALQSNSRTARARQQKGPDKRPDSPSGATLRLKLDGANAAAQAVGSEELPGKTNYFIGNDPADWRKGVPTYERVRYDEVYPGIDLIYYGSQRQLEYDFVVAPGADPKAIAFDVTGTEKLEVDRHGDLLLRTAGGVLRQHRPTVYQEVGGVRREVAARYEIVGPHKVGFRVDEYERDKALVIDPVLDYSTYLGGAFTDEGRDIAVDSSGNIYVVGFTASGDFPTASPFQAACKGCAYGGDAFVTKIDPSQTGAASLVYSTYLGGSITGADAYGVAVDPSGNIYLTGITGANDFPTTPNALQPTVPSFFSSNAFVTKLNAAGDALLYSTYLGGNNVDEGYGVAVDGRGYIYVAGRTASSDFPTRNGVQSSDAGGFDAFLVKLDPSQSGDASLVYSTYLGGYTDDAARRLAIDGSGNAYLTGYTQSITGLPFKSFPVVNGFQTTSVFWDAFAAKIDTTKTGPASLVYSSFIGGTDFDDNGVNDGGIAVDPSGNIYVTGTTNSLDFPTTPGSYLPTISGPGSAFVVKIDPSQAGASSLIYSTYLGVNTTGYDIAVDGGGKAYVTGRAGAYNFPVSKCALPGPPFGYAAYINVLDPRGSTVVYSTLLGGNGFSEGRAIHIDASGDAYIAGVTSSSNFPTTPNAFSTSPHGFNDAFVSRVHGPLACNQPPTADGQSVTTSLDTPAGIVLTASDPDGAGTPPDTLTYTIVSGPAHGTLDSPSGAMTHGAGSAYSANVTYTPAPHYAGPDSFTFKVNDQTADSNVATISINVEKGTSVITWDNPKDIIYGTPLGDTQLNATANVPGTFVYTPLANTVLPAGNSQTLHVDFVPADASAYNNASKDVQINVLKAPLTVRADDKSRSYGASNPPLTYTMTGFVGGETEGALRAGGALSGSPVLATAAAPGSPVSGSPYAITVDVSALSAANYSFTPVDGALTISRAPLTVTADDKARAYGESNPPFTAHFTGFVLGEDAGVVSGSPSFSTAADNTSAPGDYTITPALGTLSAGNYSFASFVPGNLHIDKATQTINWADPSPITYGTALGGAQLNAAVSVIGPAPAGALTYAPASGAILDAGDHTLSVKAAATLYYNEASATVTLHVDKATPTVNVTGGTFTFDGNPHPATGTVVGVGGANLGVPTFSYNGAGGEPVNAGTYTAVGSFAGNANYNPATGSAAITINRAPATISLSNLTQTYDGSPKSVTATTAPAGLAVVSITYDGSAAPPINAGSYAVVASLANQNYQAANATATLTILPRPTSTTYAGETVIAEGGAALLSGVLTDALMSTPLANRTLTLTLGSGPGAQSCSAVTDASGKAGCILSGVSQPLGPGSISAAFAGDKNYLPSAAAAPTLIFAYPAGGGNFVIGDLNAQVGGAVTFWGAQWWKLNSLSGGVAPAAFKGFANRSSTTPPSCGGTWATDPGNSSDPPSDIPSYVAVIVSSSITKSRSEIAGDVRQVVVVKTDQGYGPNPGHAGTGTVVAALCH